VHGTNHFLIQSLYTKVYEEIREFGLVILVKYRFTKILSKIDFHNVISYTRFIVAICRDRSLQFILDEVTYNTLKINFEIGLEAALPYFDLGKAIFRTPPRQTLNRTSPISVRDSLV